MSEAGQHLGKRGESPLPGGEQRGPRGSVTAGAWASMTAEALLRGPLERAMGGRMIEPVRGPSAVRPMTRPRSRRSAGERSAGAMVASGRPGSQVSTRARAADGPGPDARTVRLAAVPRRHGELARIAGRGEPRHRGVLELEEGTDPRSRSRPSGRTGPRRPPRPPSCGRARSGGRAGCPRSPSPRRGSCRPAPGRRSGASARRRRARLTGARLSDAIGAATRRNGCQASRRSTRPSPSRRRTSASSSAS